MALLTIAPAQIALDRCLYPEKRITAHSIPKPASGARTIINSGTAIFRPLGRSGPGAGDGRRNLRRARSRVYPAPRTDPRRRRCLWRPVPGRRRVPPRAARDRCLFARGRPAAAHAGRQAVENDVHIVGVSSQAAGHKTLVPALIEALKCEEAGDILVVVGGVIPPKDYDFLRKAGVSAIFCPGTNIPQAAAEILSLIQKRRLAA